MPAVVIVILVLTFVVAVCAVGVETLRRVNHPSIAPPAPSKVEVQSWRITKAFGDDEQSVEIANLWFKLNEVDREELLSYGRGLVRDPMESNPEHPVRVVRASGIVTKDATGSTSASHHVDEVGNRSTTLTPISIEIVEAERDRPSKRPTMMIAITDMPRSTVIESGMMCAICDMLIARNDSQASDGYGVTWHSRCLSQASKRPKSQQSGVSQS